jgi:hypothetical protein
MPATLENFIDYPAIQDMKKNHPNFDIYAACFVQFLEEVGSLTEEQKEQLSKIKTLELMNTILQITQGRETTEEKAKESLEFITEFVKKKKIQIGKSGYFIVDFSKDEVVINKINRALKDFYKWKKDKVKYPELWGWTDALCVCLNEKMERAAYLLHHERADLYSEKMVQIFIDDFVVPWKQNMVNQNTDYQERLCWKLRY